MASGIIPWNATPGKACGSTLGDICSTNEVRGRLFSTRSCNRRVGRRAAEERPMLSRSLNWRLIPAARLLPVLPVLSPVHRSVRRGRSHCDRSGKLPLQSLRPLPLVHLCMVCINRSCVECSSSHSHVVYVTAPRNITHWLSLSSICCSICLDAHGPVVIH